MFLIIILCFIIIILISIVFIQKKLLAYCKITISKLDIPQQHTVYYNIINKWLKNKNYNKNIADFLIKNNIKNIAIYGIGELGMRLKEEINDKSINLVYFADKSIERIEYIDKIPVIGLNDIVNQPKVDALIITPIHVSELIKQDINKIDINLNTILLDELIFNM